MKMLDAFWLAGAAATLCVACANEADVGEDARASSPSDSSPNGAARKPFLPRAAVNIERTRAALGLSAHAEHDRDLTEKLSLLSGLSDGFDCGSVESLKVERAPLEGSDFPLTIMRLSAEGQAPLTVQFWGDAAAGSTERTSATPTLAESDRVCVFHTKKDGVSWLTGEESVHPMAGVGARIGHALVPTTKLRQLMLEMQDAKGQAH